jgi:hypothetical protein
MDLGDVFKDSVLSALRARGDIGGTLRGFRRRQRDRKGQEQLLAQKVMLAANLEDQRQQGLAWVAKRLAEGQEVKIETIYRTCTILGEFDAMLRFHQGGEIGRIDVFYGGVGGPLGMGHGHIVIKNGNMVTWLAHGADGERRLKIV